MNTAVLPHTHSSHTLNVPATRGHMGNTDYYTANFPLGTLVKFFTWDPAKMASIPVEQRHQRALRKSRIPEIAQYLMNDDYVLPGITVSIDTEGMEFEPSELDENLGILHLPMETEWLVNDGQHRLAGIAEALLQEPELRYDNISVQIFPDVGLHRAQQIFSDLNRTPEQTSKSLDILFDHRSVINRITNAVVDRVPLFRDQTDKEHSTLSSRSAAFTTLSTVQTAVNLLLGHVKEADLIENVEKYEDLVCDFFEEATKLIEPWNTIASNQMDPMDARKDYLSSYSVLLTGLGNVGSEILAKDDVNWKKRLTPLKKINWSKTNPEWQGICMLGDTVVARASTRRALADALRWKLGLRDTEPARDLAVRP